MPPATAGRFLLLIAAAVASAAYIYGWLVERVDLISGAPRVCADAARESVGKVLPGTLIAWYDGCLAWASILQARLILFMLMALLVVAVGGYLWLPSRLRSGLTPLERLAADPRLGPIAADVRQWTDRAGHPRVVLYVDPANRSSRAFGRFGRYEVSLAINLLRDRYRDPTDARLPSVLAHELAHVRDRDINLTYLAITTWWGFTAVVVLPFVLVASAAPSLLADFSWRLAVLLAVLYVVRLDLLRVREHYADVAGADDRDDRSGMVAAIERAASGSRWRRGLYHPSPARRASVVRASDGLLRLPLRAVAAVGILVGLAYPPANFLGDLALPDRTDDPSAVTGVLYVSDWATGLAFGVLIAGVLTGAVWRASVLAAAEKRDLRTCLAALVFTVAVLVGQLVTPQLPAQGTWLRVAGQSPALGAGAALLLFLMVQVYLRWCVACARGWLPVVGSPRRAYRFGVVQSAVVVGIWLAAWFQLVTLLANAPVTSTAALWLASLVAVPLPLLTLVWATGYPLLTFASRRAAAAARLFRWWRSSTVERDPPLAPVRTPLLTVYVAALGLPALDLLLTLVFRDDLRAALTRVRQIDPVWADRSLGPLLDALGQVLWIIAMPALAVAALTGLLVGVWVGGRGRVWLAASTVATASLPAAALLFVAVLVQVAAASPGGSVLGVLGVLVRGQPAGSRPNEPAVYPAAGLLVLVLYASLLCVAVPAAIVGSLARATRPGPSATVRPQSPARAALLGSPLIAVALAVGGLGLIEAQVPLDLPLTDWVDDNGVLAETVKVRPDPLPLVPSCAAVVDRLGGVDAISNQTVSATLDVYLARAAMVAYSSSDRTLATLGEGTIQALEQSQMRRAAQGMSVILSYCATALTGR